MDLKQIDLAVVKDRLVNSTLRERLLAGAILTLVMLLLVTWSWTYTPTGRLDYQAALISKLASLDNSPPVLDAEARQSANRFAQWLMPGVDAPEMHRVEDMAIPRPDGSKLPVRIYWPTAGKNLPIYLDIHGGGWWMGDGFIFDESRRLFAHAANVIVVSVDYRLAPEHPFPAALEDCYLALRWIKRNAATLGADGSRIAVGGESAGGNLAAALTILSRDKGGPEILFQNLIVPVTDLTNSQEWGSYQEAGDNYVLKVSHIQPMIDAYVPDEKQRKHPWVSPLMETDFRGIPPALIVTAKYDPLRDMGEEYFYKLQYAGIKVRLHREVGAIHGFVGSRDRFLKINEMAAGMVRKALYP